MASGKQHQYRNGTAAFQFELRRTRRRTIGITVFPGGELRVNAPRRTPEEAIVHVLHTREEWILRKIAELSAVRPRLAPVWGDGMALPLLGRDVRLSVETERSGAVRSRRTTVHLARGELRVHPGQRRPRTNATDAIDGSALHRLVLSWYRARARELFSHRMTVLRRDPAVRALGQPGPLGVRRMRRRWGSCFRDGRINLNIELLGEPLALVDYVIVHELCHLREHNHGPRFYRLMDEVMPDWRSKRDALRRSTTTGFLAPR